MKNANGYGTVKKLSGKRRNPYAVLVTTGYKIVNGKARQIQTPLGYYPTQKEANLALAKYNANPYNLDHAKMTWEGVYLLWEEKAKKKISTGTFNNYRSQWNKLKALRFDRRIPRNETAITLQSFIDACCPTQPQKNSMKIFLSQLYAEALKHDIVQKDYSKFIEIASDAPTQRRKPPMALDIDTVKSFFQSDSICAKIFIVMTFTGLRIDELFNLNRVNVDFKKRLIHVVKSKTKSGIRYVPISKHISRLLYELYGDKNFVLETRTGKPISEGSFYKYYFNEFRKVNNYENTPHDCRHTFATWCKKCGVDELTRKRMLGHSIKDFTDKVYTDTDYDDLMKAIKLFDDFVEENLLLICSLPSQKTV